MVSKRYDLSSDRVEEMVCYIEAHGKVSMASVAKSLASYNPMSDKQTVALVNIYSSVWDRMHGTGKWRKANFGPWHPDDDMSGNQYDYAGGTKW